VNKISVFAVQKKYILEIRKISALARKIFLLLGKNGYSADIYLIGDLEMKRINRTYRKKDKVTNVLSFCEPNDFIGAPSKYKYLGEIYLSMDFIKENQQDLRLMVVHGMLHLLGYDHETAKDRVKMERKERSILSNIR
jgi:probable rRNA maturation factor